MKKIKLTRDQYAFVDDEDYPLLSRHFWHCTVHGYAASRINNRIVYMHRLIMDAPRGKHIDHKDCNKLNNQKSNLRICEQANNNQNFGMQKNNKSGYKGVYWNKNANKWCAQTHAFGRRRYLGLFINPRDAAKAYNEAASKYFGEFAKLNKL